MARTSNLNVTKDTSAWILQTWLFFAMALFVACIGLYHLPVDLWVRGYLTMGLFFTLGSTFSLAKLVRDNRFKKIDTNAWTLQVWLSFLISGFLTALGVYNMKAEVWIQGYAAIALVFVVSTAFTLAKTVRDNAANDPFVNDTDDAESDAAVHLSPRTSQFDKDGVL